MKPGMGTARTPGSSRAIFRAGGLKTYCRFERATAARAMALTRFVVAALGPASNKCQPVLRNAKRLVEPGRIERAFYPKGVDDVPRRDEATWTFASEDGADVAHGSTQAVGACLGGGYQVGVGEDQPQGGDRSVIAGAAAFGWP